ncbi:MAG: hypothetical protein ACOC90_07645, partial [Bacteroidota bacterium]
MKQQRYPEALLPFFSTIVGEKGKVFSCEKQSRYRPAIEKNLGTGMEHDNVTVYYQDLEQSKP